MARRAEQRRWGIRSLLFLGLAAGSIILSNWMRMTGNTDVILLTFIGTVVGLAGAAVSTIKGLPGLGRPAPPRGAPAQPPPALATAAAAAAGLHPVAADLGRAPPRRPAPGAVVVDELAVGGVADLQPGQRPGGRGGGQVAGQAAQGGRGRIAGRGKGGRLALQVDLEGQPLQQLPGPVELPLVVREALAGLEPGPQPVAQDQRLVQVAGLDPGPGVVEQPLGGQPVPQPVRGGQQLALAVLSLANALVILDGLVVAVALPAIQDDLGFGGADLQWVVNSYVLCFGGGLLLGGRAADLLGRCRMAVAGLLVFAAGSVVAGLAPTAAVLVAGRALQGTGAAALDPALLALLVTEFPEGRSATGPWASGRPPGRSASRPGPWSAACSPRPSAGAGCCWWRPRSPWSRPRWCGCCWRRAATRPAPGAWTCPAPSPPRPGWPCSSSPSPRPNGSPAASVARRG